MIPTSRSSIVVTGVGMVTPLGSSAEKTWSRLLAGESAVSKGGTGFPFVGARVFDFSPNGAHSRMGDFSLLAAQEALENANLLNSLNKNIGCVVSQSKPLVSGEALDPSLVMATFFGLSSERLIQNYFQLTGPSANLSAACATGIASIGTGRMWLEMGLCDAVLVGAAESSLNSFYTSGFDQMGVLTRDLPRPFDKTRTGFVMGEGAGVMVLERAEAAMARGAKAIATLVDVHLFQSASDVLRFDADGSAVAHLIRETCPKGEVPGYINAHGTGTVFNDRTETRGIKKALGKKAFDVPVSSTKAATGHLLGAAGAVEAVFAVLALRDQKVPPTLNLTTPDPECDLDYVQTTSRAVDISCAMSLSYGFGGQMGAVTFRR